MDKHVGTTLTHMCSGAPDRSVLEKIARLRTARGRLSFKWSRARERVLTLFLSQDHVTVYELYGLLSNNGRRVSLSTIYRTMGVLCKMGIARRRNFREEAQYDNVSSKGDHDHLICTDCGDIVEFNDSAIENLRQQIAADHGFCLTSQNLELYGLCSKCKVAGVTVAQPHHTVSFRSSRRCAHFALGRTARLRSTGA